VVNHHVALVLPSEGCDTFVVLSGSDLDCGESRKQNGGDYSRQCMGRDQRGRGEVERSGQSPRGFRERRTVGEEAGEGSSGVF
jgi:hypothetical protein